MQEEQREWVLLSGVLQNSAVPLDQVLEKLIHFPVSAVSPTGEKGPPFGAAVTLSQLHAVRATFLSLPESKRAVYGYKIAEKICLPLLCDFQKGQEEEDEEQTGDIATKATAIAKLFSSVAGYCSGGQVSTTFSRLLDWCMESCRGGGGSARLGPTICFLHHVLSERATVELLRKTDGVFDLLFTSLVGVLRCSERAGCHHVSSLILPILLVGSHQRVRLLWEFVCSVWERQVTVELGRLDLVLTLLCSLSSVFISTDTHSPSFSPSSSTPSSSTSSSSSSSSSSSTSSSTVTLSEVCPYLDIREEEVFWQIVQTGLSSSNDSLARKRCLYLLDRVLRSLQEEKKEGKMATICAPGGVFWWRDQEEELSKVWTDVRLLLETLEEKQVCATHCTT